MAICPICGPKLSICCIVISAWGIVMLILLGVFFHIQSPALFEDIAYNYGKDEAETENNIRVAYTTVAYNCWIAAGMYVLTFGFAMWQNRMGAMSRPSFS